MGRTVPWICWQEWYCVRDWLLSQSRGDIARGIRRVEAWRARGRVPLGVDITSSLLETTLCDPGFYRVATSTAATAVLPGTAAAVPCVSTDNIQELVAVSHQQLRLQYAATIVRMVNGITDSQQKGRVALSVNSLAESAGLSRLLVDVRHEATHNELPSLSTLQLAARQALDWLVQQYWQRQADHVAACYSRVQETLLTILASCEAAAAAGRRTAAGATAAAAAVVSDAEDAAQDDGAPSDGGAYKATEGRKQRKHHLAELKGLLPPSQTPLLVTLLLEDHTLFTRHEPPAAATATAAAASGSADRLAGGQQQQVAAAATGTGFSSAAQEAAFTCLQKQYPDLMPQLLEETISRLCSNAAAVAAAAAAPAPAPAAAALEQQEKTSAEADQLLLWLRLLLPGAAAAAAGGAAAPTQAIGGTSSSKGSRRTPGSAGKRTFGLTPAADAKQQQQQRQQELQHPAVTGLQERVVQELSIPLLKRLLSSTAAALRSVSTTPTTTAAAGAGADAGADAGPAKAAAHGSCGQCETGIVDCLQDAQQLLLSTYGLASRSKVRSSAQLTQLCQLAAPGNASTVQQQQQQPSDEGWLQQQRAALEAAAQQQQQGRKRSRPTVETETDLKVDAGAAEARAPGGSSSGGKRWRRASNWRPCAIGCLPGSRGPDVLLRMLASPAQHNFHANGTTAAAAAVAGGTGSLAAAVGCVHDAAGDAAVAGKRADVERDLQQQAADTEAAAAAAAVDDHDGLAADAPMLPALVDGSGSDATEATAADAAGQGNTVKLGRWWQLDRQELPQLQQAVQLLL